MEKPGLINHVISAVGIDEGMAKEKDTLAGFETLVNNEDSVLNSGSFNYRIVAVMLIYLSESSHTEKYFPVNCCARYMICTKHSQKKALNRFGCYLKLTGDRALILNPNRKLFKIDNNLDSDFTGIYAHKNLTNPTFIQSCTGYVIAFLYCPVF